MLNPRHLVLIAFLLALLPMSGTTAAAVDGDRAVEADQETILEPLPVEVVESPEATPADPSCLLQSDQPKPIFLSLTPCEQECLRNERRCDLRCYSGCDTAACHTHCDLMCAEVSNECMCHCGSTMCNP